MPEVSEWDSTEVDLSDNITTILTVPALVLGVVINSVTSAHVISITDGGTQKDAIPKSATPGNIYNFGPTRYLTSLIVDPDDAATGKIAIKYRELGRHA